jgi:hypothetical protein
VLLPDPGETFLYDKAKMTVSKLMEKGLTNTNKRHPSNQEQIGYLGFVNFVTALKPMPPAGLSLGSCKSFGTTLPLKL